MYTSPHADRFQALASVSLDTNESLNEHGLATHEYHYRSWQGVQNLFHLTHSVCAVLPKLGVGSLGMPSFARPVFYRFIIHLYRVLIPNRVRAPNRAFRCTLVTHDNTRWSEPATTASFQTFVLQTSLFAFGPPLCS